jgi:hypothetical protein
MKVPVTVLLLIWENMKIGFVNQNVLNGIVAYFSLFTRFVINYRYYIKNLSWWNLLNRAWLLNISRVNVVIYSVLSKLYSSSRVKLLFTLTQDLSKFFIYSKVSKNVRLLKILSWWHLLNPWVKWILSFTQCWVNYTHLLE